MSKVAISGTELSEEVLREGVCYISVSQVRKWLGGIYDEEGDEAFCDLEFLPLDVPRNGHGFVAGWCCSQGLDHGININATDSNWVGYMKDGYVYITDFGF